MLPLTVVTTAEELMVSILSVETTVTVESLDLFYSIGFEKYNTTMNGYSGYIDNMYIEVLLNTNNTILCKSFFRYEDENKMNHRDNDLPSEIEYALHPLDDNNYRVLFKEWYYDDVHQRHPESKENYCRYHHLINGGHYQFRIIEKDKLNLFCIEIINNELYPTYRLGRKNIYWHQLSHLFNHLDLKSFDDFYSFPSKLSSMELSLVEMVIL